MNYTIDNLIKSIAAQISGLYPYYPVYDSPNQQRTTYPCFFVFLIPNSGISDQLSEREKREITFDVVFVQERNKANANEEIYSVVEALDESFEYLQYTDGTDTVPLHTHERTYSIEDMELHYKMRVTQRVSREVTENLMQTLEETNVEIE